MNHVQLMGRLVKDLEIKTSQGGMLILRFTLAVGREFVKQGEERQSDFILCKAFGKTAEFLAKYFSKGSMVAVSGRIQTGSYEKDGSRVYTTDVIVDKVFFTGEKKGDSTSQYTPQGEFAIDTTGDDELPF